MDVDTEERNTYACFKSGLIQWQVINSSLGALPFHKSSSNVDSEEATQSKGSELATKVRPVVLADGSYATQTAAAEAGNVVQAAQLVCNLRCLPSHSSSSIFVTPCDHPLDRESRPNLSVCNMATSSNGKEI